LLVKVALSLNIPAPLTYEFRGSESDARPGRRVIAPLGPRRVCSGWILDRESHYRGKTKHLIGVIVDDFTPDPALIEFATRAADHFFVSAGMLLDYSLPPRRKPVTGLFYEWHGEKRRLRESSVAELVVRSQEIPLTFHYRREPAASQPLPIAVSEQGGFGHELLLGADRALDYRSRWEDVQAEGRILLLVVPDNLTARFWKKTFPAALLYNSATGVAQREMTWQELRRPDGQMVIGGLTALFLPLTGLGGVILDRAGSSFYRGSPFSDLDLPQLARLRARTSAVPLLEGGAGHSVESQARRQAMTVTDRRPPSPAADVLMIKKGEKSIPTDLIEEIHQDRQHGQRCLVILNRRSAGSLFCCPTCQRIETCPTCGAVLEPGPAGEIACRGCSYGRPAAGNCRHCGRELTMIRELSLDSLADAVGRRIGAGEVCLIGAAELKDPAALTEDMTRHPVTLGTLAVLNPFFQNIFDRIIYVRPESFFSLNRFDSAEQIFATVDELRQLVKPGGRVTILSAFHFHYALQLINDEEKFFVHELKYRSWFQLPPFANLYQLTLRHKDLRQLADAMRRVYRAHHEDLQIRRVFLESRQKKRGFFHGILELHCQPEPLRLSGLTKTAGATIRLQNG